MYCLLTGNRNPDSPRNMANHARTGIYRMPRGGSSWTLLRKKVNMPARYAATKPWQYPTGGIEELGGDLLDSRTGEQDLHTRVCTWGANATASYRAVNERSAPIPVAPTRLTDPPPLHA